MRAGRPPRRRQRADEALAAENGANVVARARAADDDVADGPRDGPVGVIEQAQRMV